MKKIILGLMFVLLLSGNAICDSSCQCDQPPEWVIKGDSMAYLLAQQWNGAENNGHAGYTVNVLPLDGRKLNKVVLLVGINNLYGWNMGVPETVREYAQYYTTLKKNVQRVYCVGVPDVYVTLDLAYQIYILNLNIKQICGTNYYIDTWAIPFTSIGDNIHPDPVMNALIKAKILEMDAAN
jgi:hypothetical protein